METRTGVASIVSSCERLAAEADGRILLGTGSNRASCFWGCHCRGRQTERSGLGVVVSEVDKSQSGRGEKKKKTKKKKRRDAFFFWVYGTYVDEYVCLPLLHLVVTGWRCRQCDWRLEGVHDQSPEQCVTVLLRVVMGIPWCWPWCWCWCCQASAM
ncbi:hypothetical protein HDV62DRAFT_324982 [Trichoderma sp. SZMC 28011]